MTENKENEQKIVMPINEETLAKANITLKKYKSGKLNLGILSREVRDGESAERRRFETAPKKVRCAHGNQKS